MYTEFYRLSANEPDSMNRINNRIAKIKSAIDKDQMVHVNTERDGVYLYITIQYWADEVVPAHIG